MIKIKIPSSKSISNRALILASLGEKEIYLKNVLPCQDLEYLQKSLENFGVKFEKLKNNETKIIPPKKLKGHNSRNFIGNGGTPARFLSAMSLVVEGEFELNGIERMHERPFADLFTVLEDLGIKIKSKKSGFLPSIFSNNLNILNKNSVQISGKISSQFISALILVATKLKNGLEINITDKISSLPYVQMTIKIIREFGGKIKHNDDFTKFKIENGFTNPPDKFEIPLDMSSASYPVAFSLLSKKEVLIENFTEKNWQGDEKFLEVAEKMGAEIRKNKNELTIIPPKVLKSLGKINFAEMPDISMTAIILAVFADGDTEFTGLESLRIKECDRIEAMKNGIEKIGGKVLVSENSVKIMGNPQLKITENIEINSKNDHRIAMVFGLIKNIFAKNMKITNPECVRKSWEDFWENLADWNGELRKVASIILAKEGKFLLVKKPRKNNAWQFPQGGIDNGETLHQAGIRELQEECGKNLKIKNISQKLGEYKYFFPSDFQRHDKKIKGAKVGFFSADWDSGKIEIDNNEIVDYIWADKEKVREKVNENYWVVIKNLF